MREIVSFLLITLTLTAGLRLNLDSSIVINPGQKVNVPLACTGSVGQVNYQVKGLPKGLVYTNGVIQGNSDALTGYYPVIIDARDQKNNFASQIIVFKVGNGGALNSRTTSLNNGQTVATSIITDSNTVIGASGNQGYLNGNWGQNSQQGINNLNIMGMNGNFNQNQNNFNTPNVQITNQNQLNPNNIAPGPSFNQQNQLNPNNIAPGPSFNPNQNQNPNQNPNLNPNSNQPFTVPSGPSGPSSSPSNRPFEAGPRIPLDNLLNQFAPNDFPNRLNDGPIPGARRSYPTPDLPTGPSPNAAPNLTPLLIETAKAPRLPSDKNKITPDNVKATAVFQRQLNANKAIANLLDIIEQLTANTNAAKADIPTLDGQLKNAQAVQRQTQSKVITAQNQRARLNTAIANLNDNINILRQQLGDVQNSFKDSTQNVAKKKIQLGTLIESVQKYEDSSRNANQKISKQKQSISNIDNQIKDTQNQIQANKQELDRKTKEAANIDTQIDSAVRNVKNIDEQIADLKARLNAAIKRKTQGEQQQKRLRDIKANAPIITAALEQKILKGTQTLDRLNEQKSIASNELGKLNSNLDEINLNMDRLKSQLAQIQTQIKVSTGNGQDFDNAMAAKNKQIADAIANLQFLKGQVQSYDTALRNAYNDGNDANSRVQNAQQNLDALVKKWERDTQSLSDATLNLEKARAQKELSDLAMQQLLRERSSALPYSVVPNGNGLTNAGTPTGNNPRGSPLGPIATKNNQNSNNPFEFQANNIDSFNNYLSSAYAQGVDPSIPGSVTRNFPFTIYRSANGRLRNQNDLGTFVNIDGQQIVGLTQDSNGIYSYNGDFNCGSAPSDLIDGVVRGVGNNVLNVETSNGRRYVVRVGSCSQAIANTPNYTISPGDKIKFSGQASGLGVMNLYQATCECAKCK